MSGETCPVCAEGALTEHKEENTFKDNVKVDLLFSTCDTCSSEVTSMEQSIRNRRAYVIAKGFYE